MKTLTAAVAATLLLTLGASPCAQAQQDKDIRADQAGRAERRGVPPARPDVAPRNDAGRYERERDRQRDWQARRDQQQQRWRDQQWREQPSREAWHQERWREQRWHDDGRHRYYRGERLPSQYRGGEYVVDDWRGHRLSAPPRGYRWVNVGGDYILVAIATGIIASILLNQ